jgi:hypothetical protein
VRKLIAKLLRLKRAEGGAVIPSAAPKDRMFLIDSGRVWVKIAGDDTPWVRLDGGEWREVQP